MDTDYYLIRICKIIMTDIENLKFLINRINSYYEISSLVKESMLRVKILL